MKDQLQILKKKNNARIVDFSSQHRESNRIYSRGYSQTPTEK